MLRHRGAGKRGILHGPPQLSKGGGQEDELRALGRCGSISTNLMSTLLKLPSIRNQTAFNLDRWDALAHDEQVRKVQGRIETNRYGEVIMHYYAEFSHGSRQGDIWGQLHSLMQDGKASVECPISTSEGVKVADVAWISKARLVRIGGRAALKGAPEICVEVISPSNTKEEIQEKRRLHFEAGAQEVCICDRKGKMFFFLAGRPDKSVAKSGLCPEMPKVVS
jgi:Uma2 family endonuclease